MKVLEAAKPPIFVDFSQAGLTQSRSPSSALLAFCGWEGSPPKIDYRKKSGTLILTSQIWRT